MLKDMQSTAQDLDICKTVMREIVRMYEHGEMTRLEACVNCVRNCLVDLDAMD